MEPWGWALLLKPVIGLVMIVVIFGGARLLAWLLWYVIPDGKIKRELFRKERDGASPANLPEPRKRHLD